MKLWIAAILSISVLFTMIPEKAEAGYHCQLIGVCQKCGRNIVQEYRPLLCTNGCTEWQWVTIAHRHCRPAYKGRKKFDITKSPLFSPANRKAPKYYPPENRGH